MTLYSPGALCDSLLRRKLNRKPKMTKVDELAVRRAVKDE
jgi:hypothetical protein